MKKNNESSSLFRSVLSFGVLIFFIFGATSCATSGILGFGDPLATASYVDSAAADTSERITAAEEEMQQITADIATLKTDVEKISNIKTDLDEMPKEMIRQLVEALQSYLEMLDAE